MSEISHHQTNIEHQPVVSAVEQFLQTPEADAMAKKYGRQMAFRAVRTRVAHNSLDEIRSVVARAEAIKAANPAAAPFVEAVAAEYTRTCIADLRQW